MFLDLVYVRPFINCMLGSIRVQVKVKLSQCLTKYFAMMYPVLK